MIRIREYQLDDQPIGVGGMGRVLRGVDGNGAPVAVKEILPQYVLDMEFRMRLDREILILKKLNSLNVVKIYDYFEQDGKLYIVMELVDGLNIENYVTRNMRIPVEAAIDYMIKILDTMQYIHENGIIHRDIKPNNIMIRKDGEICILDFGIAKDTTNNSNGTLFGTILGTAGYMSPEQADAMAVDHRTDIFSLGCLFFYMLTGHHAYPMLKSEYELQRSIAQDPIPRLSKYIDDAPESLQKILDKATDKNMLRRHQSAREMAEDLRALSGGGTKIDTSNRPTNISISIGREGCDINIYTLKNNISRHHADVQLKVFTGGEYIVYNDCSTNGTLINGKRYTRGMSCNIPTDMPSQVFLGCDPNCPLDINMLREALYQRIRAKETEKETEAEADKRKQTKSSHSKKDKNANTSDSDRISDVYGDWSPAPSFTFLEAISNVLNHYACFKGRASRSEYWYFALFNVLCTIVLEIVTIITAGLAGFLMIIYGLAMLIPGLAVGVRRLHDTGHSGWLMAAFVGLGGILPSILSGIGITLMLSDSSSGFILSTIAGLLLLGVMIWQLVLMCKPGTPGPNKYDI